MIFPDEIRSIKIDYEAGILEVNGELVTEPAIISVPTPDGWDRSKVINSGYHTGMPLIRVTIENP